MGIKEFFLNLGSDYEDEQDLICTLPAYDDYIHSSRHTFIYRTEKLVIKIHGKDTGIFDQNFTEYMISLLMPDNKLLLPILGFKRLGDISIILQPMATRYKGKVELETKNKLINEVYSAIDDQFCNRWYGEMYDADHWMSYNGNLVCDDYG